MSDKREIQVLIPTFERLKPLAATLTSLCFQTEKNFKIFISDQSAGDGIFNDKTMQTIFNLLRLHGNPVTVFKNLPARGIAHQRHFLLQHSASPYSLFLDDDVILEPYVLHNMKTIIQENSCGFVGAALVGLSFANDHRAHEQHIELWDGKVQPETIAPNDEAWLRYKLHNAANVLHVQQNMGCDSRHPLTYKVAWVGGCVMYDTEKLNDAGGFHFWKELPLQHCGEDVLAQLRVMKKYGGCGMLPAGAYHQEVETSISDRKINAPEFLKI